MSSFKDFLRWYNKKDVVPTLEAMQKMIVFHDDKNIDMLKLGCTLPNLANICLHKATDAKFYPFTEGDKDLLEKIREDVVGGPSIVFTRKAVVDETFIRKSTNLCKSIVGIDASQLYPYSMCQAMPTGLSTRWDFDSETSRFIPRQNKTRSFENMVMSFFQRTIPECKLESFFTTGRQKKIDCFSVDGFCSHCNTVFEAVGSFYHFCPCQLLRPSLTEEEIQRGSKKRELDALRRHYIQEKGFKVIEMWECEWWRLYKTTNTVKQHIREHFPYRRSLAAEQRLQEIKKGKLFGYVQCDIEVPEFLRSKFDNFPPIFNNTLVSKNDNNSYGYQIMERSRNTATKYLSDKETHAAINSKLFKKLHHVNNSLYEVELAKAQIEHKEPIIVVFFILQYAKLRMLELYCNFFTRFCDVN